MAYKFPGPGTVCASIEIDSRSVVAPAISTAEDGACVVAAHWLCQLCQRRLRTESPAVDRVVEIGYVLPARAAIFRLEDGEVVWVVAGERCGGDDGSILELDVARVGYAFLARGLVDCVVCEETPGLRRGAIAG